MNKIIFFSFLFLFIFVFSPLNAIIHHSEASFLKKPNGTNFLNHEAPIKNYLGKNILKENIPFIDIPDSEIHEIYYYRWSTLFRHFRYTTAGSGYILTEFVQPVWYAKAFGTIDAAAGHQIDEARWVWDSSYLDDYIEIYTRGPADYKQYSQWILDAIFRRSKVNGDKFFVKNQISEMIKIFDSWESMRDQDVELYYITPEWDAQERSLPGYIKPDSSGDPYHGPLTYRPSLNAYMFANAKAIESIAKEIGEYEVANKFSEKSERIENAMYKILWDPAQEFFVDVIKPDNPNLERVNGREEVGFFPFRFGIGLEKKYMRPSIQELFDPQGFYAPFGPTTLEIRNKFFTKEVPYCCFWQGQSWPFSTAHVLKSLASIHRNDESIVSVEKYFDILKIYTRTHRKNGEPYVAEMHFPMKDAWSGDSYNHSEHYDHSTYTDDIITGLLGVIPSSEDEIEIDPIIPKNWTYFAIENLPYHGHLISYFWDQEGDHYNIGKGLSFFIDGELKLKSNSSKVKVPIPEPLVFSKQKYVNIAANPFGKGNYPKIEASYTYFSDYEYKAIDGVIFYDQIPDNRWTNYQSQSSSDTLNLSFPRPRNISSLTLALYSDVQRGGGIDLPKEIRVSSSLGLVKVVDNTDLIPNDKTYIIFPEIESEYLVLEFFNNEKFFVGLTEIEIWVPASNEIFFAVDAIVIHAEIIYDKESKSTKNGAVIKIFNSSSEIRFSGIKSLTKEKRLFQVFYKNKGKNNVSLNIYVNQIYCQTILFEPTIEFYISLEMELELSIGNNFLTFSGGDEGLYIEKLNLKVKD